MAECFPAIRGLLAAYGIRLPQPYPHLLRTLLGSALAALLAGLLLGTGYTVYLGVSATARAVHSVARGLSSSVSSLTAESENHAKTPAPTPAELKALPAKEGETATEKSSLRNAASGTLPGINDAGQQLRERIVPSALPYRENANAPINDVSKQVDFALLQTVVRLGLGDGRLFFLGNEARGSGDGRYLFQRLRFYLPEAAANQPDAIVQFINALDATLETWSERAVLSRPLPDRLLISVDNVPTHELWLETTGKDFLLPPLNAGPRLSLVIDDMGANLKALHELLALDVPVTISIWPQSPHATETARTAHAAGREVLLHQPMEPMQAPYVNPGPGAVRLDMSAERIRQTLTENLKRVPHASGLNNHMGSRFTQDARASALICDSAAPRGLFILDSVTHKKSVLYDEARRRGLPAYRRAIFLDDGPRTIKSVLKELRAAENIALKSGQAVVIGHPHPETLAALKQWTAERNTAIHIVPLRHLAVSVETLTPEPLQ